MTAYTRSIQRVRREWQQAGADARSGVFRQAVRHDETVEIFDRRSGQFDPRHGSELVQGDGVAFGGLAEAEPGALECSVDAIKEVHHVARVGIGLVDRNSERARVPSGT